MTSNNCRMRPDVASDVGDMILTFAFLSLAPYVVNVFIVALHKGVRSSTKLFMIGAFFPCLPGMTMYRLVCLKEIFIKFLYEFWILKHFLWCQNKPKLHR